VTIGVHPLAGLNVDPRPDQPDGRTSLIDLNQRAFGFLIEHGPPSELTQRAKLDQQGSGFRGIGFCIAHFAGPEVHESVRQTGGRIENRQQPVSQILSQRKQTFIAGELITRKQPAQQPDGNLEILNVDVLVEREILRNVFPSLRSLIFQSHQNHRVERVDWRHQKRLRIPIVIALAKGLQVIVSPGVFLVATPGVQKFRPHISAYRPSELWSAGLIFGLLRISRCPEQRHERAEQ
jgi:hypothetical protein